MGNWSAELAVLPSHDALPCCGYPFDLGDLRTSLRARPVKLLFATWRTQARMGLGVTLRGSVAAAVAHAPLDVDSVIALLSRLCLDCLMALDACLADLRARIARRGKRVWN